MSCYCLSLNDYNIVYPEGNSQNFQLLIYATREGNSIKNCSVSIYFVTANPIVKHYVRHYAKILNLI